MKHAPAKTTFNDNSSFFEHQLKFDIDFKA